MYRLMLDFQLAPITIQKRSGELVRYGYVQRKICEGRPIIVKKKKDQDSHFSKCDEADQLVQAGQTLVDHVHKKID